jgi:hypothetical protein
MSETQRQRMAQLRRELQYLWRPEDRLLHYVQDRLCELAALGGDDPSPQRSHASTVGAVEGDRRALSPWTAQREGDPA